MNIYTRMVTLAMLALLALCDTLHAQQRTAANCLSFAWDQQPAYFRYTSRPQRISSAVSCPTGRNATHLCGITATGDAQAGYSYNLTSQVIDPMLNRGGTAPPTTYLIELVRSQINESLAGQPWNVSVIGIIDTTKTIEPGTSAYLNFTQLLRCYVGTLNNCTGGLSDSYGLEICTPVFHTTRTGFQAFPILDGRIDQVNISEADVSQFPYPFAGQSRGFENVAYSQRQTINSLLLGIVSISIVATIFS